MTGKALTLYTHVTTYRFENVDEVAETDEGVLSFTYISRSRPGVRVAAQFNIENFVGYTVDM